MEDLHPSDPRIIGPYRILKRIGTGGMGVVFLVEDASDRQLALKLLRPELADDPGFRSRFRREVEAAQRVGGICNARYLDADLDSDQPYLVTEYIEGGSLLDYVTAHGPLVGDQLIGLAVGLAEALVAMNAVGVIHRDLKPSNVLMAPAGPKVVDFGISHAADGTALTQTGSIIGSPGWMSPEQALGHGTTPAIDVFSWGSTIAFASTGRSPFGEGRPEAVLYRVVHEAPDLEGLDPRLQGLTLGALQKEPARRPTAEQLLVELVKTAMAGQLPPGGSIAMTTAVLDKTWHEGSTRPVLPEPVHHQRWGWIAAAVFVVVVALIAVGVFALGHSPKTIASSGSSTTTNTTTTAPRPTTTDTSPIASKPPQRGGLSSPTALVSADLPVVACPTSYAIRARRDFNYAFPAGARV